jgi:hypothetical protein
VNQPIVVLPLLFRGVCSGGARAQSYEFLPLALAHFVVEPGGTITVVLLSVAFCFRLHRISSDEIPVRGDSPNLPVEVGPMLEGSVMKELSIARS